MIKPASLKKSNRLYLKNQIELLFKEGKSLNINYIRVIYQFNTLTHGAIKILVTVPKRKFKNAVDRNHIKRLMKEAFRLNKSHICETINDSPFDMHIAFIYTGDGAAIRFAEIEKNMQLILKRLEIELLKYTAMNTK